MAERPLWQRGFGLAWLLLSIVFALHIWDEAAHDFVGYYNATVLTLYVRFPWFPRLDMSFREWLTGLLIALMVSLAFTPFAFRNKSWVRPLAYLFAGIQFANGGGHILTTLHGGIVPSARLEGAGPGFYTAPLLLASSAYLFWRLRVCRPLA